MVSIKKLTGHIGAEISGVDLTQPLSDDQIADVRQALNEHCVIFFRNQKVLPDEAHIRLGRYFGELDTTELPRLESADAPPKKDRPDEIFVIDLVGNGMTGGADLFHRDRPYLEAPPMGSILQQVVAPESGGDTIWMSTYAAYETLSDPIKELLDPLYACHSIQVQRKHSPDKVKNMGDLINIWPSAVHPVIEVHPETGRKALNVNGAWVERILGVTPAESEMLLQYLFNHLLDPRFQVRFKWNVGDVAFWDNRCTQHYAVPDYTGRRAMKRVAFVGNKPIAPSEAAQKKAA